MDDVIQRGTSSYTFSNMVWTLLMSVLKKRLISVGLVKLDDGFQVGLLKVLFSESSKACPGDYIVTGWLKIG